MMPMAGARIAEHVDGVVHLDTQAGSRGLDLTVAEVHRIDGPGSLDFGGSEFEAAPAEALEPTLASPDDDYGWWDLPAGTYRVTYNERPRVPEDALALVVPARRLMAAGAGHPAFIREEGDEPLTALLSVGQGGCRLKENCRISTLLVLRRER